MLKNKYNSKCNCCGTAVSAETGVCLLPKELPKGSTIKPSGKAKWVVLCDDCYSKLDDFIEDSSEDTEEAPIRTTFIKSTSSPSPVPHNIFDGVEYSTSDSYNFLRLISTIGSAPIKTSEGFEMPLSSKFPIKFIEYLAKYLCGHGTVVAPCSLGSPVYLIASSISGKHDVLEDVIKGISFYNVSEKSEELCWQVLTSQGWYNLNERAFLTNTAARTALENLKEVSLECL